MKIGLNLAIFWALSVCAWNVSSLGPALAASKLTPNVQTNGVMLSARIVPAPRRLQCVPYARTISGIALRGNAWTWWRGAKGRYQRRSEPRAGAVLVWAKTRRLRLGHLAVVRRIIDKRTIIVDHANWLNRGRIHLGTAVRDVSPKNDWSRVRVWYTPGSRLGSGSYATQGFIYAKPSKGRTSGPRSLPIPQRRPIVPALANRSAARIAPGPRKPWTVFPDTKGAGPSSRPAIPKTPIKPLIWERPGQDTWYLDSRRG